MAVLMAVCILLFISLTESFSIPYLKFIPKFVDPKHGSNDKWPPKFCNGLACPKYKVLDKVKDEYELRQYDKSMWVSTNLAGIDYIKASRENFRKLFDYISGNNTEGKKIDMTAPVITKVIPGQGPACENNFTMSFYISVEQPPLPKDKTVYLQKLPALKAYVRSFGGYDMFDIKPWLEEAAKLKEFLSKKSVTYNQAFFYTGGYDSPFKISHRHNEIWYLA